MGFAFEVKESDLLGRLGIINVNGRKLETPCLFPVVHPVSQSLGLEEIAAIGFDGLMTNAYILRRRREEEALREGLHRVMGFDGVLMTDSGGYQVLEYGDIDVSYEKMADFQARIGSDLAVTLDMPTGLEASRQRAVETERYSTKNALATLRQFADTGTTWIGPVQGGLFVDLLSKSAKSLVRGGFEFLALGSPVQIMQNYMYQELVRMIAIARRNIPFSIPLHLFGAGHPHTLAISVALGCDTFDSASYILFAREGRYMTERGVSALREMKYLPCSCPICRSTAIRDLLDMESRERTSRLAAHNLHLLWKEVELCKEAIVEGRLWDLVEERAASHPKLLEAFKSLGSQVDLLRQGTPALKTKGLFIRGTADRARPELAVARSNLSEAMRRSSRTAILVLGKEQKPFGELKLRARREIEGHDLYRMHSQLGPYPIELDFVYPFTQTLDMMEIDAAATADAIAQLRALGYSKVLVAKLDSSGRASLLRPKSRRKRAASSPSPRTVSSRPRAPRRP